MSGAASISALRDQIRQIEQPARHGVLPFGVAAIDRALPQGGLALGALHEFLGAAGDEEDGAAAAGFIAGILARLGAGPVLWCLKRPDLYGPGLIAHGLEPARLVLVTAPRDDDLLWALEEGLRTPGLAAVVGEIGRLPMVAGRRLQLAAERSGVTALVLRRWRSGGEAEAERNRPSAAVTRWRIAALPSLAENDLIAKPSPSMGEGREGVMVPARYGNKPQVHARPYPPPSRGREPGFWVGRPRWRVELLRARGGVPALWDLEVADATGHVSLSAALADRPALPIEQKAARLGAGAWRQAG